MSQANSKHAPEFANCPLLQHQINAPISLYEGEFELINGQETIRDHGRVELSFLPEPRIIFDMVTKRQGIAVSDLAPTAEDFGTWKIKTCDGGMQAEFLVTERSPSIDFQSNILDLRLQGVLPKPQDVLQDESLRMCRGPVINFVSVLGEVLQTNEGDSKRSWTGRIRISTAEMEIVLEGPEGGSERFDQLRRQGGYLVTHMCQIRALGSSTLTMQEAKETLTALNYWLSFCAGHWCGIVNPEGMDASGARTWWRWETPRLSSWKTTHGWMTWIDGLRQIQAFSEFQDYWTDVEWREPLQLAVHWYVEANKQDSGVEASLIMAICALEMMSSVRLVENKTIVSRAGFGPLPAADKIRVLLDACGIELDVPNRFSELTSLAKGEQDWLDGPGVIVGIRNAIVHRTAKKRDKLQRISGVVRHQALQTAIWYLELVILNTMGYEGRYLNRTKAKSTSEVDAVPWASE